MSPATIVEKLIHRHPHVFGDETAETAGGRQGALAAHQGDREAARLGDGRRAARPARRSRSPRSSRAGSVPPGLDVPLPAGDGIGYELLALAVRAEAAGTDPEAALRAAARAYRDAIRAAEGAQE